MNGKVYTVDESMPWVEAIAIRGSDIVYIDDATGAKAYVVKATKVEDLEGKLVTPGFVASH